MKERISHMEVCLHCGTTTSSAINSNDTVEDFVDQFIGLAGRCGDVKALADLASSLVNHAGCYGDKTGSVAEGPSSLSKLRRFRMARKALQAAEDMLEPQANDVHRFDSNGHAI